MAEISSEVAAFALSIVGSHIKVKVTKGFRERLSQLKEKWYQLPVGLFYLDFC